MTEASFDARRYDEVIRFNTDEPTDPAKATPGRTTIIPSHAYRISDNTEMDCFLWVGMSCRVD
jgi:hypothetical protein